MKRFAIYDLGFTICLIVLIFVLLLVLAATAAPTPQKGATLLMRRTSFAPSGVPATVAPAVTNIVLSWDPYTNAFFVLEGSTNLTTWYPVTNAPIWQTNVTVPARQPAEFFRAYTALAVPSGFFLQSLALLTNAP